MCSTAARLSIVRDRPPQSVELDLAIEILTLIPAAHQREASGALTILSQDESFGGQELRQTPLVLRLRSRRHVSMKIF
jgi:hypothetical protein